jgi:DNA-binding SARP family transcriptional activator
METSDAPDIAIRLLGPLSVRDDEGRELDALLRRPKRVALLAYLAAAFPRGFHRRDTLIGLFWPEANHDQARHALSQAIHVLRNELSEEAILTRGEDVALNDTVVCCDVTAFEAAIEKSQFESALALYRGDFLSGCFVSHAPEFERWLEDERARLTQAAAEAAWALARLHLHRGELVEAERTAQRALVLASTDESEIRRFIEALSENGDRAAAIRFFDRFRERLQTEYDLEPDPKTQHVVEQIRARRTPSDPAAPPSRHVSSTTELHIVEPPLVGRHQLHDRVFSLIDGGMHSGPHCVFVVGSTGMGKTRILDECGQRIASGGGVTVVARPLASDHDAPFSTLRMLLRGGLTAVPGAMATEPRALGTLACFDAVLADRAPPIEVSNSTDVASALVSLLREVGSEQPIAVTVDDANLADGPTIETLGAATTLLREVPFFLLLAADPTDKGAPTALTRVRSRVGRDFHGVTARLDPLELDDMRQIVEYMAPWCSSVEDLDRLSRRIQYEAAGSPFLATTLLRHLESAPTIKEDLLTWPARDSTYESPLPISVPDLVRVSVVARVGGLGEETINVLRASSMGSLALDPQLITALSKVSDSVLEASLDELERLGFIRYNGRRYAFTAPVIKETVSAEYLTHGQRQRLRRCAASFLATRDDLESRVLRVELLARSDPGKDSFAEAMAVAQDALSAAADRTARRALAAAERAGGVDNAKRMALVAEARSRLGSRE